MYIIQNIPGSAPQFHKLGSITLDGDVVSVQISTTSDMLGPGGAPFMGGGSIMLPSGAIDPDSVSVRTVSEWLVSDTGYYAGGTMVSDADFAFVSRNARLSATARNKRDATRDGGCAVVVRGVDYRIETDANSRLNVAGSVTMAMLSMQASQPFATEWRMSDNSIIQLDAAEMIAVGQAVAKFVGECQFRKNAIDALIDGLTAEATDEEVATVAAEIDEGWPT